MAFREAFPIFHTNDLPRAVAFYCERLGFEERYRFPSEGAAGFVVVSLGALSIGLTAVEEVEPAGRVALWLYCDDVDAEIEALREAGTDIAREPEDMEWGERMATVRDPDGNAIYIGQRLDAEAAGARVRAIRPDEFEWTTRPHDPGEPARHVAELSDVAGFSQTRANVWRYEPGAKGRRHRHKQQEETFVVLSGTLSMYVGDPPERIDVPAGGLIHVEPGTPLQTVNHGDEELVVYAYGTPPESEHAALLESAV